MNHFNLNFTLFLYAISSLIILMPSLIRGLPPNILIETELHGSGFHRDLKTILHVPDKYWQNFQAPGCHLLMYQVLPSDVYADPFQLKSLNPFGFPEVVFDRAVDIEAAAYASKPHELYIFINVSNYKPEFQTGHLNIELALPIHARYQKPLAWSAKSDTSVSSLIPLPGIYTNCFSGDSERTLKAPCDFERDGLCNWNFLSYTCNSPQLRLDIPVGRERDKPLVITTTLVVTIVVCAFLCKYVLGAKEYMDKEV